MKIEIDMDDLEQLEKENEQLKEENKELQDRMSKAIEYINKRLPDTVWYSNDVRDNNLKDIRSILKGEENV